MSDKRIRVFGVNTRDLSSGIEGGFKKMICIVIPTFSNYVWLARCLESIRDYTRDVEWRAVIVDNGSTDDTAKYLDELAERDKRFEIHHLGENRGFIGGTNFGLAQVKAGEEVLLLNDDTQVTDPLWLHNLKSDLTHWYDVEGQRVGFGAVGPVSNFVFGWQGIDKSVEIPKTKHSARYLIGVCLLIRSDAFQKVGFLDERFKDYQNEDFDYSIRLRQAGYQLMIDREVFILHYGSKTTLRVRTQQTADEYNAKVQRGQKILRDKWGDAGVDEIYTLPDDLKEMVLA